ncbi:MAG: hypothetical protein O7J95_20310, partial [Planctomycetota bacterium]|nr:hypothetical protein [Planctomycetota bacterium]
MNRRGKRTARLAMALGLLVLGGSGIVLWSLGQEYWHIWRLRASEETTRREAAAWLAQNGSERALPDLFERLDELYEPVDFDFDGGALHFELFEPDPTDLAHGSEVVCVLEAILRTRGAAVPGLESRLRSRAPVMRLVASAALQRLGDAAAPAVPALIEALDDKSHNVR